VSTDVLDLYCQFFGASDHPDATEGKLFPIGRPRGINLVVGFRQQFLRRSALSGHQENLKRLA
jgi:hypothetical protein